MIAISQDNQLHSYLYTLLKPPKSRDIHLIPAILAKLCYWQDVAGFGRLQIFVITYLDFGDFFDTNMISKVSDSVFFCTFS